MSVVNGINFIMFLTRSILPAAGIIVLALMARPASGQG
jgi:hypothetical protein